PNKIALRFAECRISSDRVAPCALRERKRKHQRDAYYEQEKWEYEVGGSPTVPVRVFQRPVNVPAVSRIVHQNHRRNGHATKGVERSQTRLGAQLLPINSGCRGQLRTLESMAYLVGC